MAAHEWWNGYVGLPYLAKGRDRAGLDCWGLVRLVYAEQFDTALPSLADDYAADDNARIAELIATRREGWVEASVQQSGDVVVLRIDGVDSHLGIVTQPGFFLHVREGADSVIERLDSPTWRHRHVGTYRYAEGARAISVSACPHPLRQVRIDAAMPAGTSLAEMARQIRAGQMVPDALGDDAVIHVDGEYIPRGQWDLTTPRAGACVEYRAVAGKGGTGRMLAMIAVMVMVAWLAPPLAALFTQGMSLTAATLVTNVIAAGLTVAGSLLVNSIFPVRPPNNPGQAERQNILQGGQNRGNPYGAIPSVLGRMRYTPPLGATAYAESTATDSYLRMLLVWGYGPLQISDLRMGSTPLDAMDEVEYETLSGWNDAPDDVARFNRLYSRDVCQSQLNIELECVVRTVTSATRSGNVVTAVTGSAHGFAVGWTGTLAATASLAGTISEVVDATTFRFPSTGADGAIAGAATATFSPWTEQVLSDECDRISVALHFPEGLRQMPSEGGNSGKIDAALFRGTVQVRQLDPDTLLPLTSWGDINAVFNAQVVNLSPAWYNTDSDAALEKVYRWTRLSLNEHNALVVRAGAMSASSDAPPTGALLARLQNDSFGLDASFDLLPAHGASEEPLWDICMFGDSVFATVDKRGTGTAGVSGCGLSISGYQATVAAGTLTRAQSDVIRYGASGEPWFKRKDAFTTNISFDVPSGLHEVRVRRNNDSERDFSYPSGNEGVRYHAAYIATITGYAQRRPVVAPPGVKLAMTAIRIKSSNQLNGTVDGITGTAQVICKDYDTATGTWIVRPTRNPASILRHVLQHPSNAQRVADARVNLPGLADWHDFCRTNGFMFDDVIGQQKSLLDVLRDIAAAGRASPTQCDGKWTVIIDRPRSAIAQYFTPHNSWGFEGTRALPKLPHAFRVQFINSEKGWQPDEMIVYNDGYSAVNATLFEGLTLPGVTTRTAIFKHARMHFAQIKLRPETYTLNADFEHLVCTRGDLVHATHHVPMWGIGSGRIKNYISGTELELDEAMPMDAGVQYGLRIRLENGSSVTRTVAAKVADGLYTSITLTASVTATEGKAGNLFMFGALASESVELVVLSIEPMDKLSARLTLVDYAPAVYDSDIEVVPAFDSQITLPPSLLAATIAARPVITAMVSDESVMQRLTSGSYAYRIKVKYRNPNTLPGAVSAIEGQIDSAESLSWSSARLFRLEDGAVVFADVEEGETYRIRLRYVDDAGRTGPWTVVQTHTVVGKTNQPGKITGLTATVEGTRVRLDWDNSPEVDVVGYQVRTNEAFGDPGWDFAGDASTCLVTPPGPGETRTWYVRAKDAAGLWSKESATVSFTCDPVANVDSISATFADTSATAATVTLDWSDVAPQFGLYHYIVIYAGVTKYVKASTITLPANWTGDRAFTIKVRDQRGDASSGLTLIVSKRAPNSPTNFRAQVIDNNVLLRWTPATATTLPISHYTLRKGTTWESAENLGRKDGAFTSWPETEAGSYTYWIATVDTDGRESTPVKVTAKVAEPPDFVFHGSLSAAWDGTLTNAIYSTNNGATTVVLPVDATQTMASHFSTNSWTTPQDQIDAGYPILIQPTLSSGSYRETFDFQTVLSSSMVTITWDGVAVSGAPTVTPTIEVSDDNATWTTYDNATQVFASDFRYVRVTLTVDTAADTELYRISGITCAASAKVRNDGDIAACLSTDASGTVVNFNKEFVDVGPITITPVGTTPISFAYDFLDAVLTGTYSVTSNVATIGVTGHGLVVGQNVRLSFTSGDAPNGVYTVTTVDSANQYKVAITTADTSGNVSTYPQSMRVYLFNSTTGERVSATASWALKGY